MVCYVGSILRDDGVDKDEDKDEDRDGDGDKER